MTLRRCNRENAGVAQWQSSWFVISRLMVRLRSPAPYMGDFPSGQRGQTVNLLSLTSVVRIHHPPPTKTEHLSTDKCSVFVYPSRRLGISSPREVRCISSAPSGLYFITRQRVFSCGLMICNASHWWYAATSCGWYTRLRRDVDVRNQKSLESTIEVWYNKFKGVILWQKTICWFIQNNLQQK